jgi:heme-degrading monooxygenase HmoA
MNMIARIWHGVTAVRHADDYLAYLQATGLEHTRATPGNRGVQILRRVVDGQAEFLFTSFWDSLEAIRAFAGPDIDQAVYYPEDTRFLLELEPGVQHYEVFSFDEA